MKFARRDAVREDLPRIVEIYNHAVATRESSCDLEPIDVSARERWFATHSGSGRPIWVALDRDAPERGVVGYLGFYHFMNERPGYFITSDLAIYLHPDYQGRGLGTYLLGEAVREAPELGIETLAVTIFASNQASIRLFERHGFTRWGFMPRVARLGTIERDLVMMGLRLGEPRTAAIDGAGAAEDAQQHATSERNLDADGVAREVAAAEAALADIGSRESRLWDRLRVEPARWAQSHYPGAGPFWVVAVMGNACLCYNPVEGGWGWGRSRSWGIIEEMHFDDAEIHHVVPWTMHAIDHGGVH